MRLTTFQPPELRDENNNIVQNGTYGKHTAFTNPQNSGAFDYINNNLQALNDRQNDIADSKANANEVYTKTEVDSIADSKANANEVYTKTEVDSIASGKVSKTGDTMTGGLAIHYNGSFPIALRDTSLEYDVSPSATKTRYFRFGDKNGKGISEVISQRLSNGNTVTYLRTYKQGDESQMSDIQVHILADGTRYATAPTPATTDNSTKIATTAFVNNYALGKTGGTMNGTLSFTSVAPRLVKTDNTGFLGIYGGANYADGGYVTAFGKNYSSHAGAVQLCANDGVNESQFWLHPNKNQGSDFVIEHKYDGTDGRWYRKWNSGFIEQGGLKPQGSNYTVTFLLAFPNVCKSLTFSPVWSGDEYAFSINLKTLTKTNFTVNQKSATTGAFGSSTVQFYWYACGY